jgi:hypothetical protein
MATTCPEDAIDDAADDDMARAELANRPLDSQQQTDEQKKEGAGTKLRREERSSIKSNREGRSKLPCL